MKKQRRIAALSLVLAFTVLTVTASAAGDTTAVRREAEIQALIAAAENGTAVLTEVDDSNFDSMCNAEAVYVDLDGNETLLDVDVTVQSVGTLSRSIGGGTLYAARVNTTKESDSKVGNNIAAEANLYWIDNLGMSNELYSVDGSWSPINGNTLNVLTAKVTYGVFSYSIPTSNCLNMAPKATSFYYSGTSSMVGFTLGVQTTISGNNGSLTLTVTSKF